jgi:hypothetical protein
LRWSQNEFYDFWDKVIKEIVNEIVFMDGWEYSVGCCCELLSAINYGKKIYTQDLQPLSVTHAINLLNKSIDVYTTNNMYEQKRLTSILRQIKSV